MSPCVANCPWHSFDNLVVARSILGTIIENLDMYWSTPILPVVYISTVVRSTDNESSEYSEYSQRTRSTRVQLKRPEGSKKLMVHYVAFQRAVLLLRSVSK